MWFLRYIKKPTKEARDFAEEIFREKSYVQKRDKNENGRYVIHVGIPVLKDGSIIAAVLSCGGTVSVSAAGVCNNQCTGSRFADANGDGICDNFVDKDGDGINDNCTGNRINQGKNNNKKNNKKANKKNSKKIIQKEMALVFVMEQAEETVDVENNIKTGLFFRQRYIHICGNRCFFSLRD